MIDLNFKHYKILIFFFIFSPFLAYAKYDISLNFVWKRDIETDENIYYTGPAVNKDFVFTPMIDKDTDKHCITAFNKTTGYEEWKYFSFVSENSSFNNLDIHTDNGNEYLITGGSFGFVHCINPKTGELIWWYKTNGAVISNFSFMKYYLLNSESVIFGSADGNIYCLNLSSGKLIWQFKTDQWIISPPVVTDLDEDGITEIIAASGNGRIYCLSNEGKLLWEYKTKKTLTSEPIITKNKKIFLGGLDGYIYFLNRNGTLIWEKNVGVPFSKKALEINNSFFLVSDNNELFRISLKGNILSKLQLNDVFNTYFIDIKNNIVLFEKNGNGQILDSKGKTVQEIELDEKPVSGIRIESNINYNNLYYITKSDLLVSYTLNYIERNEKSKNIINDIEKEPENYDFPDVDSNVPISFNRTPNALAVIIGNGDYLSEDIPKADFAVNDAEMIRTYLIKTFSYKKENIILIKNATKAQLETIFGTETYHRSQIYKKITNEEIDELFVYYSGHGLYNVRNHQTYLLPSDGTPDMVELNGYKLQNIFHNASLLPIKKLTVIIESCFSGITAGGTLLKNSSPVIAEMDMPNTEISDAVLYYSSSKNELSSWLKKANHSLFTYFLLRAWQGAADKNIDFIIDLDEVDMFMKENVTYWANKLYNRNQFPILKYNENKNIIYFKELEVTEEKSK